MEALYKKQQEILKQLDESQKIEYDEGFSQAYETIKNPTPFMLGFFLATEEIKLSNEIEEMADITELDDNISGVRQIDTELLQKSYAKRIVEERHFFSAPSVLGN